jgi:hypothetical protein
MIRLKINKTKCDLCTGWDDMTIEQAIRLMAIPLPESITDLKAIEKWHTDKDHINYAAECFEVLSTFDKALIQQTNANDITLLFTMYLLPLLIDLKAQEPETYKPTGIKYFELDKQKYYLPESLKIESQKLPMYSSTAVEFVESSNIMSLIADLQEHGIKYLPMLIATYCRPEGEKYDEAIIQQRSDQFKALPMSAAWEVFFCIQTLIVLYSTNILKYTRKQMQRYRMQLKVQGWIAAATRLGYIKWRNQGSVAQLTQLN